MAIQDLSDGNDASEDAREEAIDALKSAETAASFAKWDLEECAGQLKKAMDLYHRAPRAALAAIQRRTAANRTQEPDGVVT